MLPPPPTGAKELGATDHVMLGSGMPVATQVRVAGLVSFTTKTSSVMSTSSGTGYKEGIGMCAVTYHGTQCVYIYQLRSCIL